MTSGIAGRDPSLEMGKREASIALATTVAILDTLVKRSVLTEEDRDAILVEAKSNLYNGRREEVAKQVGT